MEIVAIDIFCQSGDCERKDWHRSTQLVRNFLTVIELYGEISTTIFLMYRKL